MPTSYPDLMIDTFIDRASANPGPRLSQDRRYRCAIGVFTEL
jgi:hypothetical protein